MSNPQVIPPANPEQEEILRERRIARMQRRKQSRRARLILWGTIGSSSILLGLIGFVFWTIQSLLNHDAAYPITNGISCDSVMHGTYHIHAHLTIYINGKSVTVPQGAGIAPDVNGKLFSGVVTSPLQTEVPMNSHDIITLEYGSPNPKPDNASTYHFPVDLPK